MTYWEVGSEFHWMKYPKGIYISWPTPCRWYGTGRDAFLALWDMRSQKSLRTVFVPEYFCPQVLSYWIQNGVRVCPYSDNPLLSHPDWKSINCSSGDIVLAVNYFGIRAGDPWIMWKKENKNVILVEDHTHDPFSKWARDSKADYAFASIRKILPVPDGAILWSPLDRILPPLYKSDEFSGSAYKLAAMVMKRDFLKQNVTNLDTKNAYRGFQEKGENIYLTSPRASLSPWSRFLISDGYPIEWRVRREKNVIFMLRLLSSISAFVKPLFTKWPANHCPFNVVLLLPTKKARENLRKNLIRNNIYPAIHWQGNKYSSKCSLDILTKILTIPVDHRYSFRDMERLVRIISNILSCRSHGDA